MLGTELMVQCNNEGEIEKIIKDSMNDDNKVLTFISGSEGENFKSILDKFNIKNSAVYALAGEMVQLEMLEKELIEDEKISHVAAIINGEVDNLPLMKLAKKHNKILINVEQ